MSLPGERPAEGFDPELHSKDRGQQSGSGTGWSQRISGHVTLLDVARACWFSVSTVSIVLSEAPLSQKVAERTQRIPAMA